MMPIKRRREDTWRIEKTIPVAILSFLTAQTIAVVWYFSALDTTVKTHGATLAIVGVKLDALDSKLDIYAQRLTVVESERHVRRAEIDRRLDSIERRIK